MKDYKKTYLDGKIDALNSVVRLIDNFDLSIEENLELATVKELVLSMLNSYLCVKDKSLLPTNEELAKALEELTEQAESMTDEEITVEKSIYDA